MDSRHPDAPVLTHATTVAALEALDRGAYRDALGALDATSARAATTREILWCAEVCLYVNRLEEARAWLERLESDIPEPEARRAALVAAEIDYFEGRLRDALAQFERVERGARRRGDAFALMRAAYDVGRSLRRLGEYAAALEQLVIARERARSLVNRFYEGLVGFNIAYCLFELGQPERSRSEYEHALAELARVEDLRYRAICQYSLGAVLTDLEDHDRALALLAEAEATAAELGVVPDMLNAGNNRARALLQAERFPEAEEVLRAQAAWARDFGHANEIQALQMLAIVLIERGRLDEATDCAESSLALAAAAGNALDALDAEMLASRARALSGEEAAIARLRELVARADREAPGPYRVESRVYLAEALLERAPVESARVLAEALAFPEAARPGWLRVVFNRVRREAARAPVRVDEAGALVIDATLSWPALDTARRAVEEYLFGRSMKAAEGNLSAAGRLIKQSPHQMFSLNRYFEGRLPRPPRGAGAAAKRRPRRRRSSS